MARWQDDPVSSEPAAVTPSASKWMDDPVAREAIDFNRPIADVRADIAKIPEGSERETVLKDWAKSYVARERAGNTTLPLDDVVRNFARGTIVGSFADEANAATNAVLYKITGGRVGAPYDESIAYQRALDEAIDQESGSTATKIAGGLASGAPIARAALAGAKTLAGKAARGSAFGATYGGVSGFGNAEGDPENRIDPAIRGAMFGAPIGAAVPIIGAGTGAVASKAYEAASPTLARWGAQISEIPRRIGINASADGAVPEAAGARAAAEQIIANQLMRANRSADDLRNVLAGADEARTFHSSGVAQSPLAVVDLDPSLARLAGSVNRASPEAAGQMQAFNYARQTGLTPSGPLPPEAGIPHRQMLGRPLLGRDAERQFGTRFETPEGSAVPTGQADRISDALKRAFRIEDAAAHGHGANAYRTEQMMQATLKREADKLYPTAWKQADDFDLGPAFQGLRALRDEINDPGARAVLQRAERLFTSPTGNGAPLSSAGELRRFDLAKQRLDGLIDRYKGGDTFLYRTLTKFKNDVLDAVHGGDRLNPARNKKYAEARDWYSSQKEAQEAIEMGRAAFKGDADVGIDTYRSLETEGLRKLFRLGMWSAYEAAAKNMPRGADVTRLFDNPRIQELLGAVIPRTGGSGVFANRPERFGQYIGNEKRMVRTGNEAFGNSKTAERIVDDKAFEQMSALSTAVERFRQSGSVVNIGIQAAEAALHKLFGMRADTAASLARQLFTADPQARLAVLRNIEARMGPTRFEHFSRLLQEQQARITAAGARASALPE